jgi:tetratricopeptide (TPR) repeat protein
MNWDISKRPSFLFFRRLHVMWMIGSVTFVVAAATVLAQQPGPSSQPSPGLSDNSPAEKRIIIEHHVMSQAEIDEAYRRGLQQGYSQGQLDGIYSARTERLLHSRDEALKAGLDAFVHGQYDQAADCFMLGTELDHGDPASRIHAAQALIALEQFEEAVPLIRRALSLQPRLIRQKFDLRQDYGAPNDFYQQIDSLKKFLAANPNWQDGYVLLGYEFLYSGQRAEAHSVLGRAVSLDPTDTLATDLYKASVPLIVRSAPKPKPALQPAVSRQNRA